MTQFMVTFQPAPKLICMHPVLIWGSSTLLLSTGYPTREMSQLPCTRVRCVGNAGYNSSFSVYVSEWVDCLRIAYRLLLVSRGCTPKRDFYMPRGRFWSHFEVCWGCQHSNIGWRGGGGGGGERREVRGKNFSSLVWNFARGWTTTFYIWELACIWVISWHSLLVHSSESQSGLWTLCGSQSHHRSKSCPWNRTGLYRIGLTVLCY